MKLNIVVMVLVSSLAAQHAHPPTARATQEKPVTLLRGLGTHHHPIATQNPEAQKYFDQGLLLLYGFNRYESLRSFRKATELDPQAPMAWWGVAMAKSPFINMEMDGDVDMKVACDALDKARALKATGYEQAWVTAAATRCQETGDYIGAAKRLMEAYPDDMDAATFYAESLMIPVRWNWWKADGTPNGQMDEAVRVLEQVMRRDPDHPGANHLYIHAVEMSPSPERAVPSAQRLMGVAPAAGHLVHMPGHIWLILGEWELAASVNERAVQVDRDYFAASGVESSYYGYYLHNQHFVVYARMMQGREREAQREAQVLVKEANRMAEAMPEMVDAFLAYGIFAPVRFGRWDDVMAMPRPAEKARATLALWHWARALAYVSRGESAKAAAEAEAFRAAKGRVPAEWPWLMNKSVAVLEMVSHALEARMAANDRAAAEHWRRAVELQDKLSYEEPPAWYMPLRESLGAALLRTGETAEAEKVFREALRQSPRNGRLLFGLHEALSAQGKTEAARMVQREFTAEWRKADRPLTRADL